MKKRNIIVMISLIGILLLGGYVRFVNYATWPREGATFDEYAWPWIGISILSEGTPRSWSPHGQYADATPVIYREAPFRIVQPYLEHPPLFGLISGSYAMLRGAEGLFDTRVVNPTELRKLALLFGMLSIVGVFSFTKEVYSTRIALVSALLYATIPSIAVGSRLLQNENFMIPVWLFVLYGLKRYISTKYNGWLWFVILLSSLMVLAKIPWFVIGGSCCALLVYHNKWKQSFMVGFGMLGALGLFLLWGWYWNWEVFVALWQLQLTRYDIGLTTIRTLITMPFLTDRLYADGWIYGGWIAISVIATHVKKHIWILTPFISYLLVYTWAIPGEQAQGWYRYPFYPFLTIALGYVLMQLYRKPSLLAIILQFVIGSFLFQNGYEQAFGISVGLFRGLVLLWSIPTLVVLYLGSRWCWMYRIGYFFSVCLFLVLNISASIMYNEQ
jgi:4-amino-4-deoxy-L-arabinose transferase-like glycosyltransferase